MNKEFQEKDLFFAKAFVNEHLECPLWYKTFIEKYDSQGYVTLKSFFSELSDKELMTIAHELLSKEDITKNLKYVNIIVGLLMYSEGVEFSSKELDRCFALWVALFGKETMLTNSNLRSEISRKDKDYKF